jgi:uncharacterized membrane protein (UPF0127 family)
VTNRETPAPTRRRLLAGLGTALGVAALAGCTGTDTASDGGRREDSAPAGSDTPADDDSGGGDATDDPESDTTDGGDGGDGTDGGGGGDGIDGGGGDDGIDGGGGDDGTDGGGGDDGTDDGGDRSDGGTDGGGDRSDSGETDGGCAGESVHEGYEETAVEVVSPEGELLGSVTAAVADTNSTRYLGLSDTDCLPPDRGMLFVYQEPQPLTFVMRDMDFGIDIVHIDENGVITSIQHADPPGEGESGEEPKHQYPGTGQFVLEVNYDWTTEHGVETGDVVEFDL